MSVGLLEFELGDTRHCHSVVVLDDDICERPMLEYFLSSLSLFFGTHNITVSPDVARVEIDDSGDCRKLKTN